MTAMGTTTTTKSKTKMKVALPHANVPVVAAFVLALVVSLAAAQKENSAPAKKDDSAYAELAKAPKKARARRNPLEGDPDAVAAGGKLFGLHCAECNGEMAEGGRKGPNLRADQVQQSTPGTPSGFSPTEWSGAECPCGPSCRNRSAGRL